MKIAQLAPLWESVPPLGYGGTELIVNLLTDELVRRGHDVTLFATGDSQTLARLEPGCEKALRPLGILPAEYGVYEQMQLSKVFAQAQEFDIIHSHMDYTALPYARFSPTPVVHTLHNIWTSVTEQIFIQHRHNNFISISQAQRRPELGINYIATVYNAIATESFAFYPTPDDPPYLAFLGQMSEDKGPHLAIEIAKRSGLPLKMAGKVDFISEEFFQREVAPHIDGKQVQFLGEADHQMKNQLMGRAIATLFPITWKEPFGLVTIESMVSGTPVIGISKGSVPEVIADGQTGFVCNNVDECIAALPKVSQLDRQFCRSYVENTFSIKRMVDGYEAAYAELLS
ncbi:glycosyltransferase family 4 protein [Roseofilum casamattae]|uniref:Glycosyltransferase family 4 protein n=1 Tax=Roseofilum casamattae BLCC-M143 TaxID=3022442 RepID=A0ABT7BWW6_9CYAN|nr:glycosyltransferase family 4 protein [Roseofilum casamattae]MDJ1183692.1 glycosyltransferase family 4 protein [Roseofilum casamattae BLCC-M143]